MLGIVEEIRARGGFETQTATSFAVCLKLFGEVILKHRGHPLFTEFAPHFQKFMQKIK
ncbi:MULTISPECIES: DUF3861 family protein [Cupriavidus]|uniref:DUF3861 family protein n=1 Tax=Cupriavidus sp. DF5525 TaxID=3160989 RepID=UPI0032DFDB06